MALRLEKMTCWWRKTKPSLKAGGWRAKDNQSSKFLLPPLALDRFYFEVPCRI